MRIGFLCAMSNGDEIHSSIALHNLKLQYPDSTVEWMVSRKYSLCVNNIAKVDKWIFADDVLGRQVEIMRDYPLCRNWMEAQNYDLLVDTQLAPNHAKYVIEQRRYNIVAVSLELSKVPIVEFKGTYFLRDEDYQEWENHPTDKSQKYIFSECFPNSVPLLFDQEGHRAIAERVFNATGYKTLFIKKHSNHYPLMEQSYCNTLNNLTFNGSVAAIEKNAALFISYSSGISCAVSSIGFSPVIEFLMRQDTDGLSMATNGYNLKSAETHYGNLGVEHTAGLIIDRVGRL